MNSDVEIVQTVLSTGFSNLVQCLIFIVAVLIILFSISAQLTWIVLLGVMGMMVSGIFFAITMYFLGKKIQEVKAQMNTIAEETFANVRTVKAFSTENREVGRFNEKN